MRKTAGFTLIELVIVIVILGILGAVAAPRFINMQGDAYGANVNALNGSIKSAMTLANTKAILGGYDKTGPATGELAEVAFANGFPAATEEGIIAMLQDADSFSEDGTRNYITGEVNAAGTTPKNLVIAPSARGLNGNCTVTYFEAVAAVAEDIDAGTDASAYEPARTEIDVSGC